MNKNIISKILLGALVMALGTASIAKAGEGEGAYVSANAGLAMTGKTKITASDGDSVTAKWKSAPAINFAFGYQMDEWRTELELGYLQSKVGNVVDADGNGVDDCSLKMRHFNIMGNLLYDIELAESIDWYIGGGLGLTNVSFDAMSLESKWAFAYQLMTGTAYKLNENVAFTLGYRFFSHANTKHNTQGTDDALKIKAPIVHSVEAGVRYTF